MKLVQEAKDTIEKIRIFSDATNESTKDFFDSLLALITTNHLEGKETYIPYIGSFKLKHIKDEITKEGKEAVVELEYKADAIIKKVVGSVSDNEDSIIEEILRTKIKYSLEEKACK